MDSNIFTEIIMDLARVFGFNNDVYVNANILFNECLSEKEFSSLNLKEWLAICLSCVKVSMKIYNIAFDEIEFVYRFIFYSHLSSVNFDNEKIIETCKNLNLEEFVESYEETKINLSNAELILLRKINFFVKRCQPHHYLIAYLHLFFRQFYKNERKEFNKSHVSSTTLLSMSILNTCYNSTNISTKLPELLALVAIFLSIQLQKFDNSKVYDYQLEMFSYESLVEDLPFVNESIFKNKSRVSPV
ncbi:hypothetical protein A3Q56_07238 [Intoshia linei]|uniref:Cyclin N-terminal domain-containing protein n=1 Tax=Intoshia linei TaxID=1819745 RepID=A0A177ASS1_9BILA|nr:hypothetical protein A3Q56_07238 [Intoshia linei]